ncbi:MAG: helix-turn-helix domain-containing protein, partial [Bacteroidia bacterium]
GLVIVLIIIWALAKSKPLELPKKVLMIIFWGILWVIIESYADLHRIGWLYILSLLSSDHVSLYAGPLLMIYVRSLFEPEQSFFKRYWWHFLPSLFYLLIVTLPLMWSLGNRELLHEYIGIVDSSDLVISIQLLFLAGYCMVSLRLLHRYQDGIKDAYSNLDHLDVSWIRRMLIGIMMVLSLDITTSIYEWLWEEVSWPIGWLTTAALIVLTVYIGYYGVAQSRMLLPDFLLKKEEPEEAGKHTITKPVANPVKPDEVEVFQQKLDHILQIEKAYLNEELSLGTLAAMIPTTDKKLSAFLNQHAGVSFYDLVNHYRVEAVKEKIADPAFAQFTLLALAFDSGFNSKTSFNRIFKKETGVSPSFYKKRLIEPEYAS